jgi:GH18 family chitinase
LAPFVDAAHARGVTVLASIGGGGDHAYYHALLEDGRRAGFIDRLVGLVVRHRLDGIDVDLEGKDIGATYEAFVGELGQTLRRHGKIMTSAIAVFYKDQLTDRALAQYDFVNIMSYDHTGPWRPDRPGPHSTFGHAAEALEYFGGARAIPNERMVLGVPFYGYGYGADSSVRPVTMTYKDIVAAFPGAEHTDEWKMPDGRTIYYNGIPTIQRKTRLAMEHASGIMIWQILGDAPGPLSLLRAINETARGSALAPRAVAVSTP